MKKAYNIAGIIIVCAWLALMATLVMRQVAAFQPVQFDKQYMTDTVEARQDWSGIYLKDSKIGYSCSEIKRIEEGYQLSENVVMDLTVMATPQRIETKVNAIVDSSMRLQFMSFRMFSGAISMAVSAVMQGTRLKLQIATAGTTQWKEVPMKEPPALASGFRYFVLKQGIKPGMRYEYPFFDPLTLTQRNMQVVVRDREPVKIHGQSYDCYKVETTFQGITVSSWINAQGETLREESPMGLVLVRETREQAMHEGWGDRPDITAASSITVNKAFSAQDLSFLKLRLKNAPLEGFELDGGRQKLAGDELTIVREPVPGGVALLAAPYAQALEPFLQPTPFIQSDDTKIIAFVRDLVGKEKTADAVVRALCTWVYKNIDKKPTISVPSAREVFETRQGDCNEHAVLLAALCRAAGVPCRVVAGLVHLNGGFYYHAWCEAYLGSWVTVDATMNQLPADVSHVKFVGGDMEDQIAILKLIGKLQIEVLEFR